MRVDLDCPVRSLARERLPGLLRVTMQLLSRTHGRAIRVVRRDGFSRRWCVEPRMLFLVPEFREDASQVLTGIRNPELSGRDG